MYASELYNSEIKPSYDYFVQHYFYQKIFYHLSIKYLPVIVVPLLLLYQQRIHSFAEQQQKSLTTAPLGASELRFSYHRTTTKQ